MEIFSSFLTVTVASKGVIVGGAKEPIQPLLKKDHLYSHEKENFTNCKTSSTFKNILIDCEITRLGQFEGTIIHKNQLGKRKLKKAPHSD